ncbi:hypothetical protein [Shewanella surugensis]|uniref:Uncharacterized protein n=1 Tax=Shewanella surugensis TaxID=212020 RepID=A0ABT0LEG9_9GAMM|nr:hypothetical protein [Shewanella surugensis]MCL1126101.1 hypothetical protein [Shewanella surugensis]
MTTYFNHAQPKESDARSTLAQSDVPLMQSNDDINAEASEGVKSEAIETAYFQDASAQVSYQAQLAASQKAGALALDVSQRVRLLKQQEQQKLEMMLAALEQQALIASGAVELDPQTENKAIKMQHGAQNFDGLRLQGPLLAPLEGMDKIKAVHQIGLNHLLAQINDVLSLDEADKGERS